MFREMRRKDRQLGREEAIKILLKAEYGILCVFGENGYPYGVPLNHIMIGENLYFHSAKEGQKIDDILHHNKVSFSVVNASKVKAKDFSTDFSSVIVFGSTMEVEENEKQKALLEFINKFSPAYLEEGREYVDKAKDNTRVIKIKIEHITGKARNT